MRLRKYHGLGNDYLVPVEASWSTPECIDEQWVRRICHRNCGAGSDGVLFGPYLPGTPFYEQLAIPGALAAFRILNPDGSEAEKSGNGVRIFARWLYDAGMVGLDEPFVLATLGGPVRCTIHDPASAIEAQMGQVTFVPEKIPMLLPPEVGSVPEAVALPLVVSGEKLQVTCANVGNPHCVVLNPPSGVNEATARRLGAPLECHPIFPERINVQFMERLDEHRVRIEIYERGAGYTLASGTSASACAATAVRMGWCQSPVQVIMPGGELTVQVDESFQVTILGPVEFVYEATVALEPTP